jgi:hypothetical protein
VVQVLYDEVVVQVLAQVEAKRVQVIYLNTIELGSNRLNLRLDLRQGDLRFKITYLNTYSFYSRWLDIFQLK